MYYLCYLKQYFNCYNIYFMSIYYHSNLYNRWANKKKRNPRYMATPNHVQKNQLNVLLQVIEAFRCKPKAQLIEQIRKLGYEVGDMRLHKSGGVGTYVWLPKFRRYRLQVGASHINSKGPYTPYGLCVQF